LRLTSFVNLKDQVGIVGFAPDKARIGPQADALLEPAFAIGAAVLATSFHRAGRAINVRAIVASRSVAMPINRR
jgi:hypothetical protein